MVFCDREDAKQALRSVTWIACNPKSRPNFVTRYM